MFLQEHPFLSAAPPPRAPYGPPVLSAWAASTYCPGQASLLRACGELRRDTGLLLSLLGTQRSFSVFSEGSIVRTECVSGDGYPQTVSLDANGNDRKRETVAIRPQSWEPTIKRCSSFLLSSALLL